jgi:hypothetical protein
MLRNEGIAPPILTLDSDIKCVIVFHNHNTKKENLGGTEWSKDRESFGSDLHVFDCNLHHETSVAYRGRWGGGVQAPSPPPNIPNF